LFDAGGRTLIEYAPKPLSPVDELPSTVPMDQHQS